MQRNIFRQQNVIDSVNKMSRFQSHDTADQQFGFASFGRVLDSAVPQGDLDAICAMVNGEAFDMAADGKAIVAEAAAAQQAQRSG